MRGAFVVEQPGQAVADVGVVGAVEGGERLGGDQVGAGEDVGRIRGVELPLGGEFRDQGVNVRILLINSN
jgi:hypothetical protein